MAAPKPGLGSVNKSHSNYLRAIKNNTMSPGHPRHHGVKMQAHHVLSEDGIKKSGLSKELEKFGYDINTLDNLVYIPSTLQGACHLGVQPHSGNHTAEFDDDDGHPTSYHSAIARKVQKLSKYLRNECPGGDASKVKRIKREMNKEGEDILSKIANAPSTMKLTDVAQYFTRGSDVGCGGKTSVTQLRIQKAYPCPVNHDHKDKDSIAFPKPNPFYKLTMGK